MNRFFANWNILRFIRIILGAFILIEGIHTQEWLFIVFGMLFTLMSILNVGCCSTVTCKTYNSNESASENENILYEEVK